MITQEVIDQMRAEYAAGMKISKIKEKYKLHEMALAELYRKPGKLKDVELRKRVIERYKQLQSYADVAREIGVSRQNVYALIQRTIKDEQNGKKGKNKQNSGKREKLKDMVSTNKSKK